MLDNFTLEVEFVDGVKGRVEMETLIFSSEAGVFAKLRDREKFKQVYIDSGAVNWPEDIDLAPDAMYEEIKKNGVWSLG